MKFFEWVIATFFIMCLMQQLAAEEIPAKPRVQYLQRLMGSMRRLPPSELTRLQDESAAVIAGICKSSDPTLTLSCALESAEQICKRSSNRSACLVTLDALFVEQLNAHRFVSRRERYAMMSRRDNSPGLMAETLKHRYGSLVTVFSLSNAASCKADNLECLALGIEEYCQGEARLGHLSYQSCAAVIGLFIGGHDS